MSEFAALPAGSGTVDLNPLRCQATTADDLYRWNDGDMPRRLNGCWNARTGSWYGVGRQLRPALWEQSPYAR
jgi:hypothetical protein